MNIREISDVFKDTASNITAIKSYNFGWASDRVRHGNTEDYQDLNAFPRLFFSVPTITSSDQTRKQDTYQVTLFFDDLLGYDNEGDSDLTLQIDKWAALQEYATAFIQRLNLIKQSILPNYLFIPEAPSFTFDSFVGIQRLVTVQVNFNLVVPTNCEVTVQRLINVVGSVIAQGLSEANIFLSTSVNAYVESRATSTGAIVSGQQQIIEVESNVISFALLSGDIVTVKSVAANTIASASIDAEIQRAINIISNLNATGQLSGDISLTLFATGLVDARATVNANLEVTTQGITECEANVLGTGITDGLIFITRILEAQSIAEASTQSEIILSKLLSGSVVGLGVSDANVQLTIPINASIQCNAVTDATLDVTTQNVTTFDANVVATATSDANVQLIIPISSSVDTLVITTANATLTKVLEANASATAQTSSDAQLTLAVNASAIATANTSADASLSYTVNAAADATAQTNADAFITRIISAEATATANSSAEAGVGVTFVAAAVGVATSTSADLFRTATMAASVTCEANITGATLTMVDNVAASVSAAATVSATLNVAAPLLLDLYPNAAAAYSLRKLRNAYTGSAIRVRRSSDNTEQDIDFDSSGNLNQSALTTFVGANNGFVVTWYDQSGNANNATMSTQANQPQIVSSGSVILTNGKPSVTFDGTNDSLNLSSSLTFANTGSLISFVGKRAASGDRLYSLAGLKYLCALWSDNYYYLQSRTDGYQASINTDATTNQLLLSGLNDGTNQIIYKNNSVISSNFNAVSLDNGLSNIGNYFNHGLLNTKSNLQEIIYYNIENSTNRNGINTNINTYYGIY